MVEAERIRRLNTNKPRRGDYVVYWMQQSQRVEHNPALEYAIYRANDLRLPLIVGFGLTDDYPDANERHYAFMLEGLTDVSSGLRERGILFVVQRGSPDDVAIRLGKQAALVVCDRGYLRHQRLWRQNVAQALRCAVIQVEGDVVVPIELVSEKAEYAARTIRPKITRQQDQFLKAMDATPLRAPSLSMDVETIKLESHQERMQVLQDLHLDRSVKPVSALFPGGEVAADRSLKQFLKHGVRHYAAHRNQPQTDDVSHMSKYLHFGQISPVRIAMEVLKSRNAGADDKDSLIEELIVRRELTHNFVFYTEDYDRYRCLPAWARQTMKRHRADERPHVYTRSQLEQAQTQDEYWNAAMREMRYTGYMHNYMRMYWGKKILEWCRTPEHAFRVALYLNNKYFLDGRDPNSYAGVGWVFGLHDRPWTERPIFGTVRYMNAAGLKRKCDPEAYIRKVDSLVEQASEGGFSSR